MELSELNLPNECLNPLLRARITTVQDLCKLTSRDVLAIRGVGKATLWKIESALKRIGLCLADQKRPAVHITCQNCQFKVEDYLTTYDSRRLFQVSLCTFAPVNQKVVDPSAFRICLNHQ